MIKLFDVFTIKRRYFVVDESNMIEVMKMIQEARSVGYYTDTMSVGNCGWANEPTSWFIHISLTTNQWCSLLEECKNKKYQLVIKEDPIGMYFTKID